VYARASFPESLIMRAVASLPSLALSTQITVQPSRENSRARSLPRPCAAPVTCKYDLLIDLTV
jgi:hypothetical protein